MSGERGDLPRRQFLGAGGPALAPPFQSPYRGERRMFATAAAAMREHRDRLNLRALSAGGPDDHIAVELSPMAELAERGETQEQAAFLRPQLRAWVPHFAQRVRASARQAFYPAVAAALEAFLCADATYLQALEERV